MRTNNNSPAPGVQSHGTSRNGSSPHVSHLHSAHNQRPITTESKHLPPPSVQATNFQKVNYRMPISGTYVIDPSLEMPADLICDNPTKKANLSLECTRGCITADVWLVGEEKAAEGGRGRDKGLTVIDVRCKSWMGKVDLRLFSSSPNPFSLIVSSNGGDISIALPSDFVGPITLSTGSLYDSFRPTSFTPFAPSGIRERRPASVASGHSEVRTVPYSTSITFSDAVQSRLVTFSEVGGERTCFVGDYRTASYASRKDWTGSMVDIQSSYGNLKVSFVDEPQVQEDASGCTVM